MVKTIQSLGHLSPVMLQDMCAHLWQPLHHSVMDDELLIRGKGLAHDPSSQGMKRLQEVDALAPRGEEIRVEESVKVLTAL